MYPVVKRAFDLFIILITAPLWLPLMGSLALWVKISSPGPVFFRQKRYGKDRRFFMILKFRSMYVDAPRDVPTHLLTDPAQFITPVGKWLRRTSLDELPQVINILRGDISLVGPRPALWNQDDLMDERDKYGANNIPVGLTGLAQISGRDELSIEEKATFDGQYARDMGFWLDLKILWRTFIQAISGKGVQEGGPSAKSK